MAYVSLTDVTQNQQIITLYTDGTNSNIVPYAYKVTGSDLVSIISFWGLST